MSPIHANPSYDPDLHGDEYIELKILELKIGELVKCDFFFKLVNLFYPNENPAQMMKWQDETQMFMLSSKKQLRKHMQ